MNINARGDLEKRVGAIVLAAGASRRMNRPKQLLAVGGRSLLRHTIEQVIASECSPIIVVLGAHADRTEADLEELPAVLLAALHVAHNERWSEGMSASIGAGVSALVEAEPAIAAACILVCDQPFISTVHINNLVEAFRQTGKTIIASSYQRRAGVPAVFDGRHFAALAQLAGDSGARQLIAAHIDELATISFPAGAVDLDTPEDYERFIQRKDDAER